MYHFSVCFSGSWQEYQRDLRIVQARGLTTEGEDIPGEGPEYDHELIDYPKD